jgi:hypothetical protein
MRTIEEKLREDSGLREVIDRVSAAFA